MKAYPVKCPRCKERVCYTDKPGVTMLCPGCARRSKSKNPPGCALVFVVVLLRVLFKLLAD